MKRRQIFIALTLLLSGAFAYASGETVATITTNATVNADILVVATLNSVWDGDTFNCDIAGIHPLLGDGIRIRLRGIDAPEINAKDEAVREIAIKARDLLKEILQSATIIELRDLGRDKYFRIVADVYADGVNVSAALLEAGVVKVYNGGKKEW